MADPITPRLPPQVRRFQREVVKRSIKDAEAHGLDTTDLEDALAALEQPPTQVDAADVVE